MAQDKRIKMDCPFCGEKYENIQIKKLGSVAILECTCGCQFTGNSKQELIDKWNRRSV
jgi:Lar family restriction alleviation protein